MADRIMLVDGHALVYRAYHALPALTSPQGKLVNAVYGFVSMLLKACSELKPKYLVAAFDTSRATFRQEAFEAYKGTRAPTPDGLGPQFTDVYRFLEALRVPTYRLEGYEADDLLGTLARQAVERGLDVIILTGDLDALQLVGPHVRVLTSRRGVSDTVLYDEEAVRQRRGVEPRQIPDYKALCGDVSDNIPGVPGIGGKTAARLLAKYGTVEELYAHLDELPEKQRAQLAPYAEQVKLSKRLATIVCDLDVTLDLAGAEPRNFDAPAVRELLQEFGFRSLIDRLPQVLRGEPEATTVAQEQLALFGQDGDGGAGAPGEPSGLVVERAAVKTLGESVRRQGVCALAVQGSTRDAMRADLVGIALASGEHRSAYVPLAHAEGPNVPPDADPAGGLGPVLSDPAVRKQAHNAKYQMMLLARSGVELRGLEFDTMIAAYLLESTGRNFDLRDLAWSRLQEEVEPLSALVGSGRNAVTLREVPPSRVAAYARREAELVARLTPMLERELASAGLERLFREIELPLIPVLAAMELAGVAIDVPYLQQLSTELHGRLQELEAEIYRTVGHEFNVNSTRQLAQVLYDELHLPRTKRTATGQGSTGAEVLESLRGAHPVIELILEHRQLQKLKSTYVDALPLLINPQTGRVHTSFNQTMTATGRLSSSEPNLQNIPIRTELGRRVRRAFIPGEPGWKLLSADYSQIELRILAHETQDPTLLEAFREGRDIHATTAAEVLGVAPEQVTPNMRRLAKVVNFGVLYGMSEFGLASRTELPQADAAQFIERYFERFATVKEYQQRIIREAERTGYVSSAFGRRRPVPDLRSPVYAIRQAAIRATINHPLQSAASDIMKIAMIRVHDHLQRRGLRTRMILQVHDELVFEGPDDELAGFQRDLRQIMMGAAELSVPLEVELKVGTNWEEMAPVSDA